jgi:hypothetical protein
MRKLLSKMMCGSAPVNCTYFHPSKHPPTFRALMEIVANIRDEVITILSSLCIHKPGTVMLEFSDVEALRFLNQIRRIYKWKEDLLLLENL